MLGLLFKDLLSIAKQAKIYLFLIVIFSIIPDASMTAFAIVYSAMMPITALAYDDQSKWNALAVMMPYSRLELVLSKYLFGFGAMLASALLCTIVRSVLGIFNVGEPVTAADMLAKMAAGAALICITLPFMFRFGVEKGRLLLFGIVGITIAAGFFLDKAELPEISASTLSIAAILAFAILVPGSIWLSVKAFGRRNCF